MIIKKTIAMLTALTDAGFKFSIDSHELGETFIIKTNDLYEFSEAFDIMMQFHRWNSVVHVGNLVSYLWNDGKTLDHVIIEKVWE